MNTGGEGNNAIHRLAFSCRFFLSFLFAFFIFFCFFENLDFLFIFCFFFDFPRFFQNRPKLAFSGPGKNEVEVDFGRRV